MTALPKDMQALLLFARAKSCFFKNICKAFASQGGCNCS